MYYLQEIIYMRVIKMIQVFEAFAGYGGASFGLAKAEIPYEVVGYSEIDKYAIQCYEQNHQGKNYGDITKINPSKVRPHKK